VTGDKKSDSFSFFCLGPHFAINPPYKEKRAANREALKDYIGKGYPIAVSEERQRMDFRDPEKPKLFWMFKLKEKGGMRGSWMQKCHTALTW
jgi:hypothetical protein